MTQNDKRQQQNIGKPPAQERGHINVGQPRQGFQQPAGPTIPTGPAPNIGKPNTPVGGRKGK